MEDHIETLLKFIHRHYPIQYLANAAQMDSDFKLKWEKAKSNQEWREIHSYQEVERLIDVFETTVLHSSKDIKLRNNDKNDMLLAQYRALRGLKKWCEQINELSIEDNSKFPYLTELDVYEIISRLEEIIKKIN